MINEQLDVTGITSEGKFISTSLEISDGTGTWQPWTEVQMAGEVNTESLNSIDSAIDGFVTHLCVTTIDGRLLYTTRNDTDTAWAPFQDVQTIIGGDWGKFQQVSIEPAAEELHLCALVFTADTLPHILHTILHQNGNWDQFQDITQDGLAGSPGSFVAIDCATGTTAKQILHVCAITNDGGLWHTSLWDQNQWSKFEDVKALSTNNPGAFTDVRIASTSDKLHVCAALAGDLWHTIQFTDPTIHWQDAFDNIKEVASDPGSIFSIDCATEDVKLHVCVVTEDGQLWQTMRFEDPDGWVPFDNVTAIIGDASIFLQILSVIGQIVTFILFDHCPPDVRQRITTNCYRIGRRDPNSGALRANNQTLHAQNPACSMPC